MINLQKHGILLEKTDLGFENEGVLNPAVIRNDDGIHLFYRAVSKGNYSTIGYCKLDTPLHVASRLDMPLLFPQSNSESHGIEDPRIVKIDDLYYLTYTAYDGVNALGALATSDNLEHFEKHGIMVPQIAYDDFKRLTGYKGHLNEKYARYNDRNGPLSQPDKSVLIWDKNVVFFPRRIHGNLCFLHRIKPDIQITAVRDLSELTKDFWENYFLQMQDNIVLAPIHRHEVSYIGSGCPPIETPQGWLLIYHGVFDTTNGYVYTACAALLDLDNPGKEIARLPYPLFKPEQAWELEGEVNNVCFPTGAVLMDDTLYIYYGAADSRIACASVSLSELIAALLSNKK
jgi:beta-1,2-mannobiose phosphorylase / 1,2-beta-oligomannan phosphorylase